MKYQRFPLLAYFSVVMCLRWLSPQMPSVLYISQESSVFVDCWVPIEAEGLVLICNGFRWLQVSYFIKMRKINPPACSVFIVKHDRWPQNIPTNVHQTIAGSTAIGNIMFIYAYVRGGHWLRVPRFRTHDPIEILRICIDVAHAWQMLITGYSYQRNQDKNQDGIIRHYMPVKTLSSDKMDDIS